METNRTCLHWTEWEKRAKKLEVENAELKEQHYADCKLVDKTSEIIEQLTKAKEHIENLLYYVKQCTCDRSNYEEIEKDIKEAEEFLKEE